MNNPVTVAETLAVYQRTGYSIKVVSIVNWVVKNETEIHVK